MISLAKIRNFHVSSKKKWKKFRILYTEVITGITFPSFVFLGIKEVIRGEIVPFGPSAAVYSAPSPFAKNRLFCLFFSEKKR